MAPGLSVVNEDAHSTDVDEALGMLRRVYPVARFQDTTRPFSFSQRVTGDERATLARFRLSPRTEAEVDFQHVLGFGHVLHGAYSAVTNGDPIRSSGAFLLRPGRARSVSDRLDLLMVNIDEAALADFAIPAHDSPSARLRIHGIAPVSADHAALWRRTVEFAQETFETPDGLVNPLIRRATIDALLAASLAAFPLEVLGPDGARTGEPPPAAVRRAMAYLEEHVGEPIGVGDLAIAARLSVRGLQDAFRRHLGTTPSAAIRSVRLAAARESLLHPEDGDTVARIARRWGFAHLGRFATEYRAEYGELPRTTLER